MSGKVTAESLELLHRIHRQLTDLRSRLARGPVRVAAAQRKVDALDQLIREQEETKKKTKMLADQKQLQLNEGEAKISDMDGKLNAAKSNEEFQIFKDQIAAAKMANSVLADEILEAYERVDQIEEKIDKTKSEREDSLAEKNKIEAEFAEEKKLLDADVARLEEELTNAETHLPIDVKSDYQRVVKAKGEDALAPVEDESCGQCYVKLRAQIFNDLHAGKPVFCSSCGAMLYLKP